MNKNCCKHCRRIFKPNPRLKNQLYCNRKACQRARKTKWQKQKMTNDPDYRENQKNSQKKWRENNPGYWKSYRKQHPEYCDRNRLLQKERDIKRRARHLAKMDVLKRFKPIKSGTYYLIPVMSDLAKMDALMQKVSVIPNGYEYFNESCKKGLDRPVVNNSIRMEKTGGFI